MLNNVDRKIMKPELIVSNQKSKNTVDKWTKPNNKTKSETILFSSQSKLKQIKGYFTSRDHKLEGIHESKEPVRKATLLKQLTLRRMEEGTSTHQHADKLFSVQLKLELK